MERQIPKDAPVSTQERAQTSPIWSTSTGESNIMSLRIQKLWREPLLHFLLIGAALFLYYDIVGEGYSEAPAKRIHVTSGQVTQLAANFERSRMRQPTQDELDAMVESHVREEIFYREAMAMGLDQNDPMVRRRMRMKLEFMLEDLSGQDASDDALSEFLKQNPDRFREEAKVSLRQVYIDPDRRPDLENDAMQLLEMLNNGGNPEALGDRTLVPRTYQLASQSIIARDFGIDFAREVVSLPTSDWSGPLYSPFGAHLVKLDARIDARLPELTEIRAEVLREYLAKKREQQKDLAYAKLREGYEVTVEPLNSRAIPELSSAVAGDIR
jgi:hypothetical protein